MSGKVVKINSLLIDERNLDIIVSEPYKRGWLYVVQMNNPKELSHPRLGEDEKPVLRDYDKRQDLRLET